MDDIEYLREFVGDKVSDTTLSFALSKARAAALAYCRRTDVPDGMRYVIIDMAAEDIKTSLNAGNVQSVKMGDTQYTYTGDCYNTQTGAGGAGFSKNFAMLLQQWRRL